MTWSLSEKHDWRAFKKITVSPGRPNVVYKWNYVRNASSHLVLTSFESEGNVGPPVGPGQRLTTIRMSISDVNFECQRESLIGKIPLKSFVEDRVSQPPVSYILKNDGTKRPFDARERALAGTWQRLHDTKEGELLK